jgi:hypothetical protein
VRPLLVPEKLLGEDFRGRMERFGLIEENAYGNWDLTDRDMNAIRTANQWLGELLDVARDLVRQVEEFERWDEKDWPAALDALRRHAEAARTAIKRGAP